MPTAKKTTPSNQEVLYDKLIATIPEIECRGDANPYTSLNGNRFTLLRQSRLAIRLPEDQRNKFLKKYKTTLFEAYGAVMKEYVAVPDSMLAKTQELKKYLDSNYENAKTLKPKPTTKKETLTDSSPVPHSETPVLTQKKFRNASIRTCSLAIAAPRRCMFGI